MPEYLRVKDKDTKHEYSVVASAHDPEFQTVLDKPATQADGTPLPMKPYVDPKSLSSKALSSTNPTSGQSAGPDKE